MTLSRKIAAALEDHARHAGPGASGTIHVNTDAHRLALGDAVGGPVGVAFGDLAFAAIEPDPLLAGADLRAWGDRLAARLTYLMEPLVVLEVDADAGAAELRSEAPTVRGEVRSYYEVRLGHDRGLRLQRIRFDATTRRRQAIPCQLTGEALERLADDLVASLA